MSIKQKANPRYVIVSDEKIDIGDSVKVKRGVVDPDIRIAKDDGECRDDGKLGGWVGTVTYIDEADDGSDLLTIEWDSRTLARVPSHWLKFCYQRGCTNGDDVGYMILGAADVELTKPRDSAEDREKARRRIERRLEWRGRLESLCGLIGLSLDDEDDGRIQWAVMELRADGKNGDVIEFGPEQEGLQLLERAFETHTFGLLSGDFRVNGKRRGPRFATTTSIATMNAMRTPALLVRAHWHGVDVNGVESAFQHDVIAALTPRA